MPLSDGDRLHDAGGLNTIGLEPSHFQRLLRRSLLLPVVAALLACGLLIWQIQSLISTSEWVDHTDKVIGESLALQTLMLDAETGTRGFFSGNRTEFLEPYDNALQEFTPQLQKVRNLVSDNPSQTRTLGKIEANWESWLKWVQDPLALKRQGKDVTSIIASLVGKERMDLIRGEMNRFRAEEESLRNERMIKFRSTQHLTRLSLLGALLFLSVLIFLVTRRGFTTLVESYRSSVSRLTESREWFATSLSSIGDAVITVGLDSRVTFMNPIAERLTGWRFNEAQDRPMLEVFNIINQETRKPALNPVDRVLKEGIIVGLANHTVLISKAGIAVPIEDSAAPIHDQDKMLGVILVFRDVTEKYAQQNELVRLNQDLNEALKYRDDFLSLASHELKTPLTSLKLMLEISERKEVLEPDALKRMFKVFGEQIVRLEKLVSDLLDVSHIRAQKLSCEMQDVDLAEIVLRQTESMALGCKASGSTIEVQLYGSVPLKADPIRIEQVITNLLGNAIKYGSGKPIRVSVGNERGKAVLSVQDHGIGIARDKQQVIFNRFERAVTRANFTGLGLGLYIAREIVLAHGGAIRVESEPGRGSTFTVEFPLRTEKDRAT